MTPIKVNFTVQSIFKVIISLQLGQFQFYLQKDLQGL